MSDSPLSLSRRNMLAGAALAGVASQLVEPVNAQTPPASSLQSPAFYRYTIGDLKLTAIHEGYNQVPIENFVKNASLDEVRKLAEEQFFPKDAVRVTFTTTVVETGGKLVLIDTGIGDLGPATTGRWMANFKAAGFDPAKVDRVVISHFHGDHINGLRLKDGTAQFPNAEVWVGQQEWDFWIDDGRMNNAPEAMKGAFKNVHRVFDPIAKNLNFYKPGDEVAPGIIAQAAFGHSPGHMIFAVTSGSNSLMLVSDITNHPGLFVRRPDWAVMYDMDAEMARLSRRRVLDQLASDKMQVAFYHAPFPATGHIWREGDGFRLQPLQWS